MAHIHEIGIASDTKAFDQGFKTGVIRPVEDAVQAFEDLERQVDGADYSNVLTLEDDLKDTARAAHRLGDDGKRSLDKLERALEDAQRETDQLGRKARDAGDDAGQGFGRMRAASEEVTNEIGSNLGEAVSSVRGDLGELGQVGQDTLGGLAATVAGMGPAGLAGAFALAAGAVGLGALTAGIEDAKEKQEKLNESAAKFAEGYISGIDGAIDAAQVFAEINSIATDPERYKVAGENAKNWGVDVSTAMRAMAGDATAIGTVELALAKQKTAMDQNAQGADNMAQNIEAATTGQSSANSTYLAGKAALDELNSGLSMGAQQAANAQRALFEYASQVGVATGETDDLGNAIVRLPGGKDIVVNAETKTANEDVDFFEQKVQGIKDKTATVRLRLNTDEWDKWVPGAKVGQVRTAVGPGGAGGTTWY